MPAGPRCATSRSISSMSGAWRSRARLGTCGRNTRQRLDGQREHDQRRRGVGRRRGSGRCDGPVDVDLGHQPVLAVVLAVEGDAEPAADDAVRAVTPDDPVGVQHLLALARSCALTCISTPVASWPEVVTSTPRSMVTPRFFELLGRGSAGSASCDRVSTNGYGESRPPKPTWVRRRPRVCTAMPSTR